MPETGPSPIDEAEKESQAVALADEISSLRRNARTESDYESILPKLKELRQLYGIGIETKLSGELAEQIEAAKEIPDFVVFGPDEVREAYEDALDLSEIPAIDFSKEELERAKELGQMLVLRVGKLADGRPLTMKRISEVLGEKTKDDGKVYFDTDWYKAEKFFTDDTEAIETRWALVSKEILDNSTDKNYLEQTDLLVDYIKDQVFKDAEIPPEFQEAIDEFFAKRTEIATTMESDWPKAAEQLAALKLNQLVRRTPAEVAYDLMLNFQNTDERLLPDVYDWTNRRISDGDLVCVGGFESGGVRVVRVRPGSSYSALGVSFSRSR